MRVGGSKGVGERDRRGNGGVEQIEKGFREVDVKGLGAVDGGYGCRVVGEDYEGVEVTVAWWGWSILTPFHGLGVALATTWTPISSIGPSPASPASTASLRISPCRR